MTPFIFATLWIIALGPVTIEGGGTAIKKDSWHAFENAWHEREPLKADRLGNYGNE